MLDRIHPYAPHAVTGIGVLLYYLRVPYGGLVCFLGFTLTGIYYLLMELKSGNQVPRYFRLILILIPVLILVLAGQWLIWGDNTFLMIVLLIIAYSFLKAKVGSRYQQEKN